MPWSLHEFVRRNVHFDRDQQDLMRCTYMLCALHAMHRQGPDEHDRLGVLIDSSIKAVLQAQRDRSDWTLAWFWTGQPDPAPRRLTTPLKFIGATWGDIQTTASG